MSDARKKLGAWGENLAQTHLQEKGYEPITQNWRCKWGEIDLIMKAGQEWVFVEVKTRRGQTMGSPEEGVTPSKAKQLLKLAQIYLAEHDLDVDWRVDLVAIQLDKTGKLLRCEHLPNAVLGW